MLCGGDLMTQTGSVPKNSDPRRRSQAPGWLKAVLPSCWLATFDGVSRRTAPHRHCILTAAKAPGTSTEMDLL